MQNDPNGTNDQQTNNPNNSNKEYPGYAPDPQSGIATEASQDTEANDNGSATRLAAKGPVRNPNYHPMDDKTHVGDYTNKSNGSATHIIPHANDENTPEGFDNMDPKSDTNVTADTEEEDSKNTSYDTTY